MLERASGQFIIDGQVEDIFGGISGAARIARISQSCRFSGQLEGESMAEFTAVLPREGDGSFHGFQRVSGTLGEREGSFVLSVTGEYVKGQPRGAWTIVPKSGSGDFAHIRGGGAFSLPHGKPGTYKLEFDLRKPRSKKTADDQVAEAPPETAESLNATPVTAPEKPARKTRAKPIEAPAEDVAKSPTRRTRARKADPVAPEPVTPSEPPAKRTRSRKSVHVEAETPASPVSKPKRKRQTAPVEPPAAESAPAPAKTSRRKHNAPDAPIALPVAEQALPRKRRAKAA